MNEFYSSLFLLISEIGVFLLLILGTVAFMAKKRSMKDKALAIVLVEKIKKSEPKKREKLLSMLKDVYGYDDEKAEEKMDVLIKHEKRLYNNLIHIFLKKDRGKISDFDKYLNDVIESYQGISNVEGGNGSDASDNGEEGGSNLVITREENSKLRDANKKLKKDLDAAMQTMESMMSEYASMYEGGKKDGEQRMKNEMFKLKQVLEKESDEDDDTDGGVEDLDIDFDEIDLDEDTKSDK